MLDLIIIGGGPAGITASIYAARKKMDFIVITADVGGQTLWTKDIENYTGFQLISGMDLLKKFREHMEQFRVQVRETERAHAVLKEGNTVIVKTNRGEYLAKSVIVASGRVHRKLGVEGEDVYKGKGVAYCATCDAPLFGGMDVVVVGGGNAALDATIQLMKIARRIYLVDVAPTFAGDPVLAEKVERSNIVTICHNATVSRIYGEKFVSGATVRHSDGRQEELAVRGVFVGIGSTASSDFVHGVAKNDRGEILVNCKCETNVPGIFAAGDVTNVPAKQIVVASGEGAKATIQSFHYMTEMKEEAVSTARR